MLCRARVVLDIGELLKPTQYNSLYPPRLISWRRGTRWRCRSTQWFAIRHSGCSSVGDVAYDGDAPLDPVVHRVPARVKVDVRDVVVPVQVGAPRPRQRA
eukprot:1193557-Prorocentrum_minimum.AAC.1